MSLWGVPASATEFPAALVDNDCYAAVERNRNARDTLYDVDRDRDWEIRYCRPGPKTKALSIVDRDGQNWLLDTAGNARALDLVRGATKRSGTIQVIVSGEKSRKAVRVESIRLNQ
jgi:hypothetical protein